MTKRAIRVFLSECKQRHQSSWPLKIAAPTWKRPYHMHNDLRMQPQMLFSLRIGGFFDVSGLRRGLMSPVRVHSGKRRASVL